MNYKKKSKRNLSAKFFRYSEISEEKYDDDDGDEGDKEEHEDHSIPVAKFVFPETFD